MEGKKRYIAIILFLLICLMLFTFATTGDEELEAGNGNGNDIQEVTNKGDSDEDEEKDSDSEKEESNDQSSSSTGSSNNGNSNAGDDEDLEGTGNTDNSAWDNALKAVEELEKLLTDDQLNIARELVEEITNSDQYKELIERVEDAEDAIDATALVEALEKMVEEAAKREDIEDASDFRDDEVLDAVNEIDGEYLEEVKEDLLDRIEKLNKILDDATAPKVEGIEDGDTTKKDVELTITDDNEVTTTVTKDGQTYEYVEKFTEEGTYELTVVDSAFNETKLTFTIDKTAAKVKSSDFYVHGLTAVEKVFYTQKGNKITVNVKVNEQLASVPTFTLHSNGKDYVLTDVLDRGENAPGVWLYQASYVIEDEMADGEVTFTISNIVDLAGNVTDNVTAPTNGRRIIVDNTAPVYENLALVGGKGYWFDKEYKQFATNGTIVYVNVRFKEKLATTPVVTLNDTIKLTKPGTVKEDKGLWIYSYSYRLTEGDGLVDGTLNVKVTNIADLAGNTLELTNADCKMESQSEIIVDRHIPEIILAGTEGLNKNEYKVESGTEVTLADVIATVKDADQGSTTINPYKADLLIGGKEENIYNYDFSNGFNTRYIGRYNIYYEYTDLAGNKATATMLLVMTDTTPASITLPFPMGRETYEYRVESGTKVTVEDILATVTDNVDPESKLAPYKADLLIGGKEENIYNYDFSNGFDTRYIGRYNIYYTYTDKAGHTTNATLLLIMTDTTPATITLPGTEGLNKNEYIVEAGTEVIVEDILATVTDNVDPESKLAPYKADLLISNKKEENKYNYDFSNGFETNYHGRYNLYYTYTDKAGHTTNAGMMIVMKDTVAPTLEITEKGNMVYVRGKDVTRLKYTITKDGKTVHTVDSETCGCGNYFSITWLAKTYGDGEYTIDAVDAGGNKATAKAIVDTTAPTYKFYKEGSSLDKDEIQPTIVDGKLYFNQNVRVRFVEETTYFTQYIHNDFVNNEDKTTIKTWTREAKTNGKHTMKVTDAKGNVTEVTFYIDKTAPTLTVKDESVGTDPVYSKISFKLSDNEKVDYVMVNGNKFDVSNAKWSDANYNNIKNYLVEGENTVVLYDIAGNSTTKTFTIDWTAPAVESQYRTDLADKRTDVIGSDAHNIVFEIYKDDKLVKTIDEKSNYKRFSIDWLGDGVYKVVVTDIAGLSSKITVTIDHTAPVVTPSYTELTVEGDKNATFNQFPTFEIEDLTEVKTELISGEVNMGKVGEYTLTYKFTDEFNNSSTQDVVVKVVDTTAPVVTAKADSVVYVEYGTSYTELGAIVKDNIDEDRELTKPSYINLYELGENNATGPFVRRLGENETVDPNVIGKYLLVYTATDAAGNASNNQLPESKIWVIVRDTTAPTFRFTKAGSSLVKDEIQPTLVDGVYYFNQPVRVTISDSLNLRLHGVNSYYDDNNPNRTGWLTDLYEDGEYTAVGVDSFNNRAEFKFVIYIPREENKQINISKDITLQNTPFFNEVDSTGVTINGNGHTVTQNVTDPSLFTWYDLNNKVRPLMGNMFATKAGEKITINDLTFAGTTQYIALGQYRGSTYTTYSTELNNVNVIGLNIVSYSTNPQIAAAVITYGANTVLNNTNIYNTKMSSMDPHGHKIYDFAVVNYTNTTINGGKIGTIYTWANANLTIKGATVGTIDSKIITGTKNRKLLIEAGSIVDRINVVNNDVYTPGLVIKNGATVKELNISKITKSQKIVIENGATIEKVITADSELTLEEAVNNGLLVIS